MLVGRSWQLLGCFSPPLLKTHTSLSQCLSVSVSQIAAECNTMMALAQKDVLDTTAVSTVHFAPAFSSLLRSQTGWAILLCDANSSTSS